MADQIHDRMLLRHQRDKTPLPKPSDFAMRVHQIIEYSPTREKRMIALQHLADTTPAYLMVSLAEGLSIAICDLCAQLERNSS